MNDAAASPSTSKGRKAGRVVGRVLLALLTCAVLGVGVYFALRPTLVRRAVLPRLILDVPPSALNGAPSLSAVTVSPDGKTTAGCEYLWGDRRDGQPKARVFLWDAATGRLLRTIAAHRQVVWSMEFSPDNRFLLTSGADSTLRAWRVDTGALVWSRAVELHALNAPRFSPKGTIVAAQAASGRAAAWDAATGRPLSLPPMGKTQNWPKSCLSFAGVGFSPDGRLLAVPLPQSRNEKAQGLEQFVGGGVQLYDTQTGRAVRLLPGRWVTAYAFSPDGRRVAMAFAGIDTTMNSGSPIRVQVCDVQTGRVA